MAQNSSSSEVQLGPQGRLVIPAALREALHLNREIGWTARRGYWNGPMSAPSGCRTTFVTSPEPSAWDELLAERRAEVAKEAGLNLGLDIQSIR